MKVVADESVDFGIIFKLRQKGIEVISITEDSAGIKDVVLIKDPVDLFGNPKKM